MPLLEARDVTVRFGGLVAVDRASLSVDPGQVVGLIGPNGAGKTTLLGALSGETDADEGRVSIDGRDVTGWGPAARARAGLARTFQRLELFRNMTVFENLLVGAEARFGEAGFIADVAGRARRGPAEELAREVMALVGLEDVADRRADEVPLGIGRLIEVGRALCTQPRLLLLDEPVGGLDETETDRLASVLTRLDGPGIVLVEHDIRLVMGLCHRVLVMDFGKLIAEGTPDQIRADPAVQAAYLGEEVAGAGAARG